VVVEYSVTCSKYLPMTRVGPPFGYATELGTHWTRYGETPCRSSKTTRSNQPSLPVRIRHA
jgi:hypothetical protein